MVVSILVGYGTVDIEILTMSSSRGSYLDGYCRYLYIGELRCLLIEIEFVSDVGTVDVSVDAGVIAVEHEGFDIWSNKCGD